MASGSFSEITVGTGLTGTDLGDGHIEISATAGSSDPSTDTLVWMPLTTVTGGVPELVWEADNSLIPTLTGI